MVAANTRARGRFIRALFITAAALASTLVVASSLRLPTAAPPAPPRGRLEPSTDATSSGGDGAAFRGTKNIGRGVSSVPVTSVPESTTRASASIARAHTRTLQRRTQDNGAADSDAEASTNEPTAKPTLTAEERANAREREREALVKLYEATSGEGWEDNSGWLQGDHCGGRRIIGPWPYQWVAENLTHGWYGVECNNEGYVSWLSLPSNSLSGTIPKEIGELTQLNNLNLYDNALMGHIPTEIGQLAWLRELYLNGNELTGTIPTEIPELTQLSRLYLDYNALTGPIPSEIGKLKQLKELNLHKNTLEGPIPTDMRNLTQLYRLFLSENNLTGPIPSEIVELKQLGWLYLFGNTLTGAIPTEIGQLMQLLGLYLGGNTLTGPIPTEIRELKQLQSLILFGNELTGPIPTEIGELTKLEYLYLNENTLTGPIPSEFWELMQLQHLNMSKNSLSGTIPIQIGNMTALEKFSLNENRLTGTIPTEIGMVESLLELDLHSNFLSGNLPSQLGNLAKLEDLNLASNKLSETVPWKTMKSLTSLRCLDLSSNSITGTLSDSVMYMTELEKLLLDHNAFSGNLPSQFKELSRLTTLRLNNNAFRGQIPVELGYGNLQLRSLDLSYNKLTGSLPIELGWLTSLRELNVAKNEKTQTYSRDEGKYIDVGLKGPIPAEYGDLAVIEVLDLSGNLLTGSIPHELGNLGRLRNLSLADNRLSDRIPTTLGQLSSEDEAGYFNLGGNEQLKKPAPLNLCISGQFDLQSNSAWCPQERSVLKRFYDETEGQDWLIKKGWDDQYQLPCEGNKTWHGIRCNGEGEVVTITLSSNGLSGRISEEIANISALEHVDFSGNDLRGTIPSGLVRLHNLASLRLSYNVLTGTTPSELGELQKLSLLHLHGNRLNGTVELPKTAAGAPSSSFIADCGSPSNFEPTLKCESCSTCCNSLRECEARQVRKITLAEQTAIFMMAILAVLCILPLLVKGKILPGFKRHARNGCGETSVYSFFLSDSPYAWLVPLVTIAIKTYIYVVFLHASSLDFGGGSTDFKYSWSCPLNSEECTNGNSVGWSGWLVFAFLMFAKLTRDFMNGFKLVCSRSFDFRCFLCGTVLIMMNSFALYCNLVYNKAIARTNTGLILSAAVLLFINDLDEALFTVANCLFAKRVHAVISEAEDYSNRLLEEDDESDVSGQATSMGKNIGSKSRDVGKDDDGWNKNETGVNRGSVQMLGDVVHRSSYFRRSMLNVAGEGTADHEHDVGPKKEPSQGTALEDDTATLAEINLSYGLELKIEAQRIRAVEQEKRIKEMERCHERRSKDLEQQVARLVALELERHFSGPSRDASEDNFPVADAPGCGIESTEHH